MYKARKTSPSAIWVEASEAQRDELHRLRIFFRLIGARVANRIEHSSKVSRFFVGAKQRGQMGEQSQAPKQALGVVTLHAICEE